MNQARYAINIGAQQSATSALAFGGENTDLSPANRAETESWNGTNWTAVNALNTARYSLAGTGADNTAALAAGGVVGSTYQSITELWNGSNWTEVNNLNSARAELPLVGTSTAALAFDGRNPSPSPILRAVTESWNGTNWTELNDLNTARRNLSGSGTQTLALAISGTVPPISVKTEEWNGVSWVETSDLNVGHAGGAGCGTSTNAIAFAGSPGSPLDYGVHTEEWSGSSVTTKVLTD